MSIEIPWTRIAQASPPRPVLFSGNQEGALGGATLPLPRIGDRFAIDITTTQFRQDAESQTFLATLMQGLTDDARIAIFQPPGRPTLPAGAAMVDGGGQSGSTINLKGMQSPVVLAHGRFFNIVHGGIHYLHMTTAQVVVGADGKVAVPIWPMLRFLTVDAEPCEIDRPVIEGQLTAFADRGAAWLRNRLDPISFSITERG